MNQPLFIDAGREREPVKPMSDALKEFEAAGLFGRNNMLVLWGTCIPLHIAELS